MFYSVIFDLLAIAGKSLNPTTESLPPVELVAWHEAAIFNPPDESHLSASKTVESYLQNLEQQGIIRDRQGVWLQSDWSELGSHNGTTPLPAASLTKIATTLVAIDRLGVDRRFVTKIYYTGKITEGTLQGDLIVAGDNDPFFVWEEAIALANSLNQLGIQKITGDLLVADKFYMNYQSDRDKSASLLYRGLNPHLWSSEIERQFATLPSDTALPQLKIQGRVKLITKKPESAKLIISHNSLPLVDILRQMNIYSNNYMAQMLADLVGGATVMADLASQMIDVPSAEIQLINGSGLGVANQISPHAATKMLIAIDNLLKPHQLSVADILPVAGRDFVGTMENRNLPQATAIKTGTLNQVSALAGVIPLNEQQNVWFTTINYGWQIRQFRQQQDELLQELVKQWGRQEPPQQSKSDRSSERNFLGDPQRNQLHSEPNNP